MPGPPASAGTNVAREYIRQSVTGACPGPPASAYTNVAREHVRPTSGGAMKIEERSAVTVDLLDEAWAFYEDVFTEVNALAANRHLMTFDEFEQVMADRRVQKWFAFSDDGRIIGMSTITNVLSAWPLVSPAFFAERYPSHYERQAIWYIGFICCNVEGTRAYAFRDLIARVYPQGEASQRIFGQAF